MATGLWVPEEVNFVGSNLVEGYESISTDPEEYKDQAVLILGKGNSAFETAQSILGRASRIHLYSPSPVRLAWQTHYVGDLRCSILCLTLRQLYMYNDSFFLISLFCFVFTLCQVLLSHCVFDKCMEKAVNTK